MEKLTTLTRKILPASLQKYFKPLYRVIQSKFRAAKRIKMKQLSSVELKSNLRNARICQGDIIMVHSSLSSIGNVDGGAETIIKSFIDTVKPIGTIMMPCYNSGEDIQQGMEKSRFIDLRTSKSDMGKISEVFRTWPGVFRSSHPFSSVCAWGSRAEYITSRHAINPYICHSESPVGRMVELNVKIVGIGVSLPYGLGLAHILEDTWDDFPFESHAPPFQVKYIDCTGNTITRDVIRYDSNVSVNRIERPGSKWFCELLAKHFTIMGILHWFRFGNADSWIMEAQPLYTELKRLAEKGITIYLTKDEWKTNNAEQYIRTS